MNLPERAGAWNRALLGAFKKGVRAQQTGEPIDACPYADKRDWRGSLTWSRSFIKAWRDGWRWAAGGRA